MSAHPKVSVITITYNQKKYIRDTLEGFIKQKTDFEFDVIIADDCSTDGTAEIIREYATAHPSIFKPIFRKKNVGAWSNFLDAIQSAKGTYIALCEGDDYWTEQSKLQKQADFLDKNTDYSLCFHPVKVFFQDQSREEYIHPSETNPENFTTLQLLKNNFIQTNSVMYRRQPYSNLVSNMMPGDWYLHLYHAQFGKIGFINQVMSVYRRHHEGIWWQSDKNVDEIWKKYGVLHYGLYVEMLKMYGQQEEYATIINQHIDDKLEAFIKIDKKYKSHLINGVLKKYPESVERHIIKQSMTIQDQIQTIKDTKHKIDKLDIQLKQKNQIIYSIKASRVWKLRNKIAKYIGKEPI